MIPPSIPAGIPERGPCTDCSTIPSSPGLKAGKGLFHRVLDALIGGVDVKADAVLPAQAARADSSSAGEAESSGVAGSLRLASLASEGAEGISDSPGVDSGSPATLALYGVWQAISQPAASVFVPPNPGPGGAQGLAHGPGVAAMPAGGRQQLPPFLAPGTADATLTGQIPSASGQSDAEAGLSRLIPADVTAGPVPQPLQHGANTLVAPERPFDPARMPISRELLTIQLPLRAQGWDGELVQRIVWMAGRQAQWAEISLNPPNLGNLEVHLSLKGNDASAYFYSPHAAVREAIDESLSRLREMLASAGISLGQTQVSQESFGDRRGGRVTGFTRPGEAGAEPEAMLPAHFGRGLVDLYV